MAVERQYLYEALKKHGREDYTDDIMLQSELESALSAGDLREEATPIVQSLIQSNPLEDSVGGFSARFKDLTKDLRTSGSPTDALRASVQQGIDLSFLKNPATGVGTYKDIGDIFSTQEMLEEEPDGFIWGNIKRGVENNVGLAKLMSGMIASGVGADSLGEALKASANQNFEAAEKLAKTESYEENPLAWAGQVILEGIPDIGLTLLSGGTAAFVTGGARMLAGRSVKKVVREQLKKSLTKGLAGREGAEAIIEGALKDEVIDSVAKVGLRDAFTTKGRQTFAKNFGEIMKNSGIELSDDALKSVALGGARRRAAEGAIPAAAAFTWGALTTDGDIARDLYDETERLRAERANVLVEGGMKQDAATAQALKEITDPTLGDLGVGGLIAPITDMFVPFIVGKQVGLFKGSQVGTVMSQMGASETGKKILRSMPAGIAKGAIPEGATEAIQGAMAEAAKYNMIKSWSEQGLAKEQEETLVDYLLRPEARARYLAEFAGGALMGGLIGGVTGRIEAKRMEKQEKFIEDLEAQGQVEPDTPEDIEQKVEMLMNPENWKDEFRKNGGLSAAELEQKSAFDATTSAVDAKEAAGAPTTRNVKGKEVPLKAETVQKKQEELKTEVANQRTDAANKYSKEVDGTGEIANLETNIVGLERRLATEKNPEVKAILRGHISAAEAKLVETQTKYEWAKPIREITQKIKEIELDEVLPQEAKDDIIKKYEADRMAAIDKLDPEQARQLLDQKKTDRISQVEKNRKIAEIDAELATLSRSAKNTEKRNALDGLKNFYEDGDIETTLSVYGTEIEKGLMPEVVAAATDDQLVAAGIDPAQVRPAEAVQALDADIEVQPEPVVAAEPQQEVDTIESVREEYAVRLEGMADKVRDTRPALADMYLKMARESRDGTLDMKNVLDAELQGQYRDLREGEYSDDPNTTTDVSIENTTASETDSIRVKDENGWHYRMPKSGVKSGTTRDRVSLNVIGSPELIAKMDAFAAKHGIYYKAPSSGTGWNTRHDPITIYADIGLTDAMVSELTSITKDHIRSDMDMPGQKLSDGIFKEKSPTQADIDSILARAKALGIEDAVRSQLTTRNKLGMSAGQWSVLDKFMSRFEQGGDTTQNQTQDTQQEVDLPVQEQVAQDNTQGPVDFDPDRPETYNTEAFRRIFGFEPGAVKDRQQEVIKDMLDYSESLDRTPKPNLLAQARKAGWDNQGGIEGATQHLVNRKKEGVRKLTQGEGTFTKTETQFARPTGDQTTETTATNADELKAWAASQRPGFLAGADIKVVDNDGLPGAEGKWYGAYKDGVIYLNSDTLTTEDVQRVVFHESLGHGLAKHVLGERGYRDAMNTIMKEMKRIQLGGKDIMVGGTSISEIMNAYKNLIRQDGSIDPALAEEVWSKYIEAHTEGQLKDRSLLFRIFDQILEWVRKARGIKSIAAVDAQAARAVRRAHFNSLDINQMRSGEVDSAPQFDRPTEPNPAPSSRDLKQAQRINDHYLKPWKTKAVENGFIPSPERTGEANWFDNFFRAKQWIAEKLADKYPQIRGAFQALTDATDRKNELVNKYITLAREFTMSNDKTGVSKVEKILIQGDIRGEEYATAQEAGLTDSEFVMYQSARRSLDAVRDEKIADAQRAIDILNERIEGQGDNIKGFVQNQIKELQGAITQMKSIKGFFPRTRSANKADYDISYFMDGKLYYKPVEGRGRTKADALEKELLAQGATDVKITQRKGDIRETSGVTPAEVGQVKNLLYSVLGNDIDSTKMIESLLHAKGFKKHYIQRQSAMELAKRKGIEASLGEGTTIDPDSDTIYGYQTEGLGDVMYKYFQEAANDSARSELAKKMSDYLNEKDDDGRLIFDPKNQFTQGTYKEMKHLVNAANTGFDNYSGTVNFANKLMFHMHIGFRASSALWNSMHVHMFGASLLRSEMTKAGLKGSLTDLSGQFAKTHKDSLYFMRAKSAKQNDEAVTLADLGWGKERQGLLDAWNKFYHMAELNTLTEQFRTGEAMKDRGLPKNLLAKASKLSGWMMHKTELANRLTTFGVHYDNMGGDYDGAKRFVRLLNGSYEKFNMPGWLQGDGVGNQASQILFNTFRTHVQNTYEIMGDMYKHDKTSFAYSMMLATAVAGVPGAGLLEALTRIMFGDDSVNGSAYLWMKSEFGDTTAKAVNSGLISVLTDVDTSGSLGLGAPPIVDAAKYIAGMDTDSALVSPFKGMVKAAKGEMPWYKGVPFRFAQSVLTAVNEGDHFMSATDDPQVTVGRRNILNSDGTPMKLTGWESLGVAVGLTPMRRAEVGREIWQGFQVRSWLDGWKGKIIESAKAAKSLPDRAAVNAEMKEFNDTARELKRNPVYKDLVRSQPVSWDDARKERNTYKLSKP